MAPSKNQLELKKFQESSAYEMEIPFAVVSVTHLTLKARQLKATAPVNKCNLLL